MDLQLTDLPECNVDDDFVRFPAKAAVTPDNRQAEIRREVFLNFQREKTIKELEEIDQHEAKASAQLKQEVTQTMAAT